MTTGTLSTWNVPAVVCIAAATTTGGLASGLPCTAGVTNISDIIHSFDHEKSSSILQLIKSKSRNLQNLLNYLNGTTTYAFKVLLSSDALSIIFVLYWKDLLVIFYCYSSYY